MGKAANRAKIKWNASRYKQAKISVGLDFDGAVEIFKVFQQPLFSLLKDFVKL